MALPFNPRVIDQQWFEHTLPVCQPVQMPAELPAHLHQYWHVADGQSRLCIQNRAKDSYLRTFLFNQMACNHYANPDYQRFLLLVMQYTEVLLARGGAIERLIDQAAEELCEATAAFNTITFPELSGFVEAHRRPAVDNAIKKYQNIQGLIMNHFNQQPQFAQPQFAQPQGFVQQAPVAVPQGQPQMTPQQQQYMMQQAAVMQQNAWGNAQQAAWPNQPQQFAQPQMGWQPQPVTNQFAGAGVQSNQQGFSPFGPAQQQGAQPAVGRQPSGVRGGTPSAAPVSPIPSGNAPQNNAGGATVTWGQNAPTAAPQPMESIEIAPSSNTLHDVDVPDPSFWDNNGLHTASNSAPQAASEPVQAPVESVEDNVVGASTIVLTSTTSGQDCTAYLASEYDEQNPGGAPAVKGGSAYNKNTHERYYVIMEDGDVEEYILPRGEEEMEYSAHEHGIVTNESVWTEAPEDVTAPLLEIPEVAQVNNAKVSGAIEAHSFEEASFRVHTTLNEHLGQFGGDGISYQTCIRVPYCYEDNDVSFTDNVDRVFDEVSIASVGGLVSYMKGRNLPAVLVEALSTRILRVVNMYAAQIGIRIDELDDFNEVCDIITKEDGEAALTRFNKAINSHLRHILSIADADTLVEYIEVNRDSDMEELTTESTVEVDAGGEDDIPFDGGEEEVVANFQAILFEDNYYITEPGARFADIGLTITGKFGGLVKQLSNPEEYNYLETLLESLKRSGNADVTLAAIRTDDNQMFYITNSWLGNGIYLSRA